jgi:hypothetical protein
MLGLDENADAPTAVKALKALQDRLAAMEAKMADAEKAALNKEAAEFVAANAAKIKDPDKVKAQYVLNKDATIALFGAMAEPSAQPHQVLTRDQGRAPAAQIALNSEATRKAEEQHKAAMAYAREHGCKITEAYAILATA